VGQNVKRKAFWGGDDAMLGQVTFKSALATVDY